jgi:hypothetical protein
MWFGENLEGYGRGLFHSSGGTEESNDDKSGYFVSAPRFKSGVSEYEAGVLGLTTRSRRSIIIDCSLSAVDFIFTTFRKLILLLRFSYNYFH